MKRDTKNLLIAGCAFFFAVLAMPKVIDIYRRDVARRVIAKWKALAEKYAAFWSVEPRVVLAIICQESSGNPNAVNPSDPSRGLMQITQGALTDFNRAVGRSYTFDELFEPYKNIEVGTWYYASRFAKTKQQRTALAAYNAGLGNIPAGLGYAEKVEAYLVFVNENYEAV